MNGGSRIIALDGSAVEGDSATPLPLSAEHDAADDVELADDGPALAPQSPLRWIVPAIAAVLLIGWTVLFAIAKAPVIRTGPTPDTLVSLVTIWSLPAMLVLIGVLIARTTLRDASRHAAVIQALADESRNLDVRLRAMNTELSLARDFIAAQGRDLESLGRIAVDRLSGSAERLKDLIAGQGKDMDHIGVVAAKALENISTLRTHLPVISNSAKDAANAIAQAGRTADTQLEDLITGFNRLNEFGSASGRKVEEVRAQVDAALEAFADASERIAFAGDARLRAVIDALVEQRAQIDREEIAALAAIRTRAETLGAELASQSEAISKAEDSSVTALTTRVDAALAAFASANERIGQAGDARLRGVIEAIEAQRAHFDREEMTALAAIRARAETLAGELARQREVISTAEDESLAALATRIAALDGDVRKVAGSLARAIEEVGRDHDQLVADSRERLRRFEESAGSLGRALVDEAGSVDDALAVRRHALEAALTATAEGFAARLEALDTAIGQRRAAMAAAAADSADALDTRLAQIDSSIEAQRQRQIDAIDNLATTCDTLTGRIAGLARTIDSTAEAGTRTASLVDAALVTLTSRLTTACNTLDGTDQTIVDLTDAAVRLLELIEAARDHTQTQIPEALRSAIAGLDGVERRVVNLRDGLREAGNAGTALADTLDSTETRLDTVHDEIATINEAMLARAAEQEKRITALRDMVRAAQSESDTLAGSIERRLAGAIAELEAAAHKAGADLGDSTAAEISAMAARFGEETSSALARVVQGRGAQMIARLEEAMDSASASARETAVDMRDQLARIDELASNLESRVNHIRERAEEQVDSDFARRTALITESLNSTSIDISRILSAEVSETAWASYLRGERGIFTRRAVSLLDAGDVRVVQQHYENDDEFRLHVNRYIHDFEGMLRQLLSTRDGNALGVTLLSSDMGKLYVALAQGIERLRT